VESVHESDLQFFHKGLALSDIYRAIDTLISLGYSAEVGADLRLKIGFIPWHPLTTVQSLRDAVSFVKRYNMPPKLLRRRLLLESVTGWGHLGTPLACWQVFRHLHHVTG